VSTLTEANTKLSDVAGRCSAAQMESVKNQQEKELACKQLEQLLHVSEEVHSRLSIMST
jgi:hypothetical protein